MCSLPHSIKVIFVFGYLNVIHDFLLPNEIWVNLDDITAGRCRGNIINK